MSEVAKIRRGGIAAYMSMVSTLTNAGLLSPTVPPDLVDQLRARRWFWTTSDVVNPMDVYIYGPQELETWLAEPSGFWAFGHAGHGINSYAIGLVANAGGLLVTQQHAWGGAYMDDDHDVRLAAGIRAWCRLQPSLTQRQSASVAVMFSPFRAEATILSNSESNIDQRLEDDDRSEFLPDGWYTVYGPGSDQSLDDLLAAKAGNFQLRLAVQHLWNLCHPDKEPVDYERRPRAR